MITVGAPIRSGTGAKWHASDRGLGYLPTRARRNGSASGLDSMETLKLPFTDFYGLTDPKWTRKAR
jgi:hypothetical protein